MDLIVTLMLIAAGGADRFPLPVGAPVPPAIQQCVGQMPGTLTVLDGRWAMIVPQQTIDRARDCWIKHIHMQEGGK